MYIIVINITCVRPKINKFFFFPNYKFMISYYYGLYNMLLMKSVTF